VQDEHHDQHRFVVIRRRVCNFRISLVEVSNPEGSSAEVGGRGYDSGGVFLIDEKSGEAIDVALTAWQQSQWSKWAALAAGAASLLQALSILPL
jgi:hypothetical protein